ncbi:MAG: DUF1992 domain-containing protein [Deltaproteobacteria bacterium]|nr:DUF1992 domain-containing protein [Deltaproteobacteria bacterium]
MAGIQDLIERKIKEAQERGEFDNLPGKGKPLKLEDDSGVPEDLRVTYKILKNADCLPPELELKKEIRQMEDMLAGIPDEKERYRLIKKINLKITRLNMMGRGSPLLEADQAYYGKVLDKLNGEEERGKRKEERGKRKEEIGKRKEEIEKRREKRGNRKQI